MNCKLNIRDSIFAFLFIGVVLGAVAGCTNDRAAQAQHKQIEQEPVVLTPEKIIWTERPSGVKVAILQGDPMKPGPFTLRLQYPAGYRKDPHYHPNNAYVTVLSGGYYRGYGNTFDETMAFELTPGTFSLNPSNVSHYEWTTMPATLQVSAIGPWSTTFVDSNGLPLEKGDGTKE